MNFIELQTVLQNINNSKVSLTKIAEILEVTPANISKRAKNGSEITVSELQKIEKFYGINIYKSNRNSLERRFEKDIERKHSGLGSRISVLQNKNNLSDMQAAVLLNISETEFSDIIQNKAMPDIKLLDNFKRNFDVSIDWLLYGE